MAILKNLTIRTKVVVTMGLMMTVLAVGLTTQSYIKLSDTFQSRVQDEHRQASAILAFIMRTSIPGVRISNAGDGLSADEIITWRNPPTDVDPRIVESVQELSGMDNTIFAFDADTGNFVRIASTITNADGTSVVGTAMDRNGAYEALLRGESTDYNGVVSGILTLAHYRPIFDLDGENVTGAIAMSRLYSEYEAQLAEASSVQNKILVAGAILLITLILSFLIVRRMLAPLTEVTGAIVNLSQDDLTGEIRHADRSDEIGKVAGALLVLQESMQKAEDLKLADINRLELDAAKQRDQSIVVEALSGGLSKLRDLDLTARIESTPDAPFPDEYDGLRVSFNELVDRLSQTITAIQTVAEEVSGDAREMAESSGDLSHRTESQAATLQQSAAALEELSQSVQSTAENAADAEATTIENRTVAKETGDIVNNAITAMEAIEASSQQITQIISVIDDIAFQTNLLALNAGVEAARAGDAGRGFAVVASEVRALAQHSSASAQEIKNLIAASSEQVSSGSKLVRATGQSLGDIISRVDRVASLVSDIAVAAKEQSIGVSEINSGVRDLDAATQRNAAMAEEASAASEGLTNAADRLASHLGRFQMANAAGSVNWAAAATARPKGAVVASSAGRPMAAQASNGGVLQMNVFKDF